MTDFSFQSDVTPPNAKKIILDFLNSINPQELSQKSLETFGWGTSGDPVVVALEILKDTAENSC